MPNIKPATTPAITVVISTARHRQGRRRGASGDATTQGLWFFRRSGALGHARRQDGVRKVLWEGRGAWEGHRGAGGPAGPWKVGRMSTGGRRGTSKPKGPGTWEPSLPEGTPASRARGAWRIWAEAESVWYWAVGPIVAKSPGVPVRVWRPRSKRAGMQGRSRAPPRDLGTVRGLQGRPREGREGA